MPELNFDNPQVREEMLNVAKYYLDLGVDGFRFDAVKYIYYGDHDKSVEFWKWYLEELRASYPDIYCVGECWSGENEILEYYSAMNCFNFAMAQAEGVVATAAKGFSITTYTNYIESFQKKVLEKNPEGMVMPFLSNHDMDRIAGAFILENNMRMAANLYLLSPGSPVIYYGEEIGMRGSRGGENTDANRRLAMLWGDDDLIRDPVGATYPEKNQIQTTVADQMADENSLYRYYCALLSIRHKYPAIARGQYTALNCGSKNFGGFLISFEGEELGLFHNTGMRQNIFEEKGFIIIEDCYNAGPESMEAALRVLGEHKTEGRRIAVLGDMLELGSRAMAEHYRVGRLAAAAADLVLTYGEHSERIVTGAITGGVSKKFAMHFDDQEDMASTLKRLAKPGDVILFKGSRGMHMEKVLKTFLEKEDNH